MNGKWQLILKISVSILILISVLTFPGCKAVTKNGDEVTPSVTTTVPSTFPVQSITCTPEELQPLPGSVAYHSHTNYLSVQLPVGWAVFEGPESLVSTSHLTLQIAFNSWGKRYFWAHSFRTETSEQYGADVVASQVPEGGAYLALVLNNMPPVYDEYPLQYPCNDLSSLLLSHNWRQPPASSATFINFFKWGRSFNLEIYCSPEASDETIAELNQMLVSWRFDENWVGDVEWAATLARTLIPEEAHPLLFPLHSGRYGDYYTEVEARNTTVHFKFSYCPDGTSCHWWEIDVPPDGQAVLIGEGGEPLSK